MQRQIQTPFNHFRSLLTRAYINKIRKESRGKRKATWKKTNPITEKPPETEVANPIRATPINLN